MPLFALLALIVSAGIALAGCGDDGPDKSRLLSRSTAADLRSTLNSVERLADEGDCDQAKAQATALQQQIASLRRIDPKLRASLEAGAARLQTLVSQNCAPAAPTGTTGATGPVEPQPQDKKAEKKKNKEKPGKGNGNGPEKQTGDGGDQQSGGVEINPGNTPQGTSQQPGVVP